RSERRGAHEYTEPSGCTGGQNALLIRGANTHEARTPILSDRIKMDPNEQHEIDLGVSTPGVLPRPCGGAYVTPAEMRILVAYEWSDGQTHEVRGNIGQTLCDGRQ